MSKLRDENLSNTLRRVPVPKEEESADLLVSGEDFFQLFLQRLRFAPNENIRSDPNCYWTLLICSHGQAWRSEVGSLFLNATGIGDHNRKVVVAVPRINRFLVKAMQTLAKLGRKPGAVLEFQEFWLW